MLFDFENKLLSATVFSDPFPHLIIEDFLPKELYLELQKLFEDQLFIDEMKRSNLYSQSNQRVDIPLFDDSFFSYLSNYNNFYKTLLNKLLSDKLSYLIYKIFGENIVEHFVKGTRGKMSTFDANKIRTKYRRASGIDLTEKSIDPTLYVNLNLGINTRVFGKPSSARGLHIDALNKSIAAFLYCRPDNDNHPGGDLLLCKFKTNQPRYISHKLPDHNSCEASKLVKYKSNCLVIFMNSVNSLHLVTPRPPTSIERRFFVFTSEFRNNVIDPMPYLTEKDKKELIIPRIKLSDYGPTYINNF